MAPVADQRLRRDAQRIGRCNEIGLVRGKKIEHGLMGGAIGNRIAQAVGRQPGQREETPGAFAVAQNPAERRQRERGRIGFQR